MGVACIYTNNYHTFKVLMATDKCLELGLYQMPRQTSPNSPMCKIAITRHTNINFGHCNIEVHKRTQQHMKICDDNSVYPSPTPTIKV